MSKSSKKNKNKKSLTSVTVQPRDSLVYRSPRRRLTNTYLTSIEDHRRIPEVIHDISPSKTLRDIHSRQAQTVYRGAIRHAPPRNVLHGLQTVLHRYFTDPLRSITCIRRRTRRRVLHALRKTGSSGRYNRPPIWTWRSYIRCK